MKGKDMNTPTGDRKELIDRLEESANALHDLNSKNKTAETEQQALLVICEGISFLLQHLQQRAK